MSYRQTTATAPLSGDFVYVIQGRDAVKIGVTRNLDDRLATLQTGSPHPLTLAYHMPIAGDAYAVEAEAHAMLDRHRLAGEWFGVSPDVAVAAVSAAAYRLGVTGSAEPTSTAGPASWLKRIALIAALFTPQWIALDVKSDLAFAVLFIAAMLTFIVAMVRVESAGRIGFVGFLQWAGALTCGLAISVVLGIAIGSLIGPAMACEGCGCAGGPGYRLPSGRCASWVQFKSDCNGACFPPGTRDERGGLMLKVPPLSAVTSIGATPSISAGPVTPK